LGVEKIIVEVIWWFVSSFLHVLLFLQPYPHHAYDLPFVPQYGRTETYVVIYW